MAHQFWIFFGALLICDFISGTSAATSCVKCHSMWGSCVSEDLPPPTTCNNANDQCYTILLDNHVLRGCLSDSTASAYRSVCTNATDLSCVTCTDTGCNNLPWLKCHNCDSIVDQSCSAAQPETGGKFCSTFNSQDHCYTMMDGNNVSRGCLSEQTACNNDVCTICSDELCNKLSIAEMNSSSMCLQCDSSDATCAAGTAAPRKCVTQQDNCYTRVAAGILERGCLSSLPTAEQSACNRSEDTTCTVCDSAGCNTDRWLQCHQCSQVTDPACATQQINMAEFYCQYWNDENRCYERMEGTNLVRGCENDIGKDVDACLERQECRTCSTDGCNREAPAVRQCLQCSTESTDVDGKCLAGTASSQPCAKALAGKCYSKIDENGALIRGCQSNLTLNETLACAEENCNICETDHCNMGIFPRDRLQCHQCMTNDTDRSCAEELNSEQYVVYCQKHIEDDKCFTKLINGTLERGCQSDLHQSVYDHLTDEEYNTCSTRKCNTLSEQQLKGAAGINKVSLLLVMLSVLVATLASSEKH